MQTLYVPKYGITYRVNQKNPRELLWSVKPFGPATQWQHAYTFSKPIRALDTDDQTGQGVVVLNDSTTYVGSGVRVWGKKFYTAGSRIYSLYAIGESKEEKPMSKMKIKVHEAQQFKKIVAHGLNYDDASFIQEEMAEFAKTHYPQAKVLLDNEGSDKYAIIVKSTDESDLTGLPESFELEAVIAELDATSYDKPKKELDVSNTFSDEYLDKYVKSIKGKIWSKADSNRLCDELNASIDSISDEYGQDNTYDIIITNDDNDFEITLTLEYSRPANADTVIDATWKRL